jgi:hypothetical protein
LSSISGLRFCQPYQTIFRNVKPTFKSTSQQFKNMASHNQYLSNLTSVTIFQASKGKAIIAAWRDQVHTQEIMKNCWHRW